MALPAAGLRMGWRKRAFPAFAGLLVLAIAAIVHFFNPDALQRFGYQLFDQYQRSAPRAYEDVGVRVVDIDEESIDRIGQWPWPRTLISEMTEKMVESGAGVVAFDIVFSEPDRTSPENLAPILIQGGADPELLNGFTDYIPHDIAMSRAFGRLPVIMGYFLEQSEGDSEPLRSVGIVTLGDDPKSAIPAYRSVTSTIDVIERRAQDAGFVSVWKDSDGIIRRAPMLAVIGDEIYPSLSLSVLRYITGAGSYILQTTTASGQLGARQSELVSIKVGPFVIPTTPTGEMWLRYTPGPALKSEQVIPAWKLLDEDTDPAELQQLFDGTIVFVGTGAQGLRDLVATPTDPLLPGVMVHAQALEQILLQFSAEDGEKVYLSQPDWAPGVRMVAMLVAGLILIFIIPITGPLISGILGAGVIGGLFGLSWHLYTDQLLLFDPVYPAIAVLLVYGATSLVSFVVTEAEKSYIKDAFDRYLSPEMVEKIADDPSQLKLGGEERDMTILFSDIRSFTKISEGMTPEELTSYLNRYLTPMTDILMAHKATVDKYIGDAVMSFWNAPLDDPDHHKNAARSALQMMSRLNAMNALVGKRGIDPAETLPVQTKIGIGIQSGRTSVGNMGSDQRFNYSVLGDTVNTASRLEGMTKQYGVGILLGEELAGHLTDFAILELDRAQAVGKQSWLAIYALIGDEAAAQLPKYRQLVDRQAEFLKVYRARQFDEALTLIDELLLLAEGFDLRSYYDIMRDRINTYRNAPPPEDWDGVYILREK